MSHPFDLIFDHVLGVYNALWSSSHTPESLTHEYQRFVDELLPLALEEAGAAFGYSVTNKQPAA
jgi:hypothetical protein